MVIWESLSELEKANWLGNKSSTSKDWVVWCNSKKEVEEDCRLEHHGKKATMMKRNQKLGKSRKRKKKAGQSVRYRS